MSGAVFGDPGDLFAQPPPSGDSDEGGSTQEPLMGTTNGAPQSPGAHRQLFGGISRIRRGAPIPEIRPADPFDPEIFNRRFFPHDKSILPDCKAPRK
jgi:hypothetical protein